MKFFRQHICLIGVVLFAQISQASTIKGVNNSGGCDNDYFLVADVCVSNQALSTYSSSELVQLISQYKGLTGADSPTGYTRTNKRICESKVSENEDDYFELRDGSVLKKTGYGYVGYIGYAKKSLLIMKSNNNGTLMIEGKSPFSVEILRAPQRCSSPSTYRIEMAYNDEKFIVNGEMFEAQTYCLGWSEGESVIFLDGSEYGACASAELYNVQRGEECSVWCE